ncbi:MAG TPA: DNA repair protein RadA [Bacillota bacterium]|nr:DNA repair protein RadA [Bacillota bacterium]HOA14850.1 DNA repair protein RadA [Bacillota bacterium]HOG52385.1 DNA repair protein RadA [Bacillota bacterium]
MKKARTRYVCQQCGAESASWYGKCPSCSSWNSLVEEAVQQDEAPSLKAGRSTSTAKAVKLSQTGEAESKRLSTGIAELDRVLGGGLVAGSAVLISGEPGIGKSTLLMQAAVGLSLSSPVLYVSGEESVEQVGMRARRLKADRSNVLVLPETDIEAVIEASRRIKPAVLMVDSIQTAQHASLSSASGSVGQVRQCAASIIEESKSTGMASIMVGHVTKTGAVAGPKVLEHMVDTVLQFEGGIHQSYRVVRTLKNRFGSTDEVGVFEMGERGLVEVANPSEAFLRERVAGMAGSVVVPCMEGTRPFLVELQALVGSPGASFPRRTSSGVDAGRVAIMLAVLGRRIGIPVEANDTYMNVAGGISVDEPAADLGIALALASSYRNRPLDSRTAVFGEVGLSGELRSVHKAEARLAEATRLGFTRVVMPKANFQRMKAARQFTGEVEAFGAGTLAESIDYLLS